VDAIAFNSVRGAKPAARSRIHAAFRLDVNEYQGYRSLQLIIEHMENGGTEVDASASATTDDLPVA